MAVVTVVGSGPSGVHFASALLEEGHEVRLLDVGTTPSPSVEPDVSLERLKEVLEDSSRYFLGDSFQGVHLPDGGSEYYGLPPSKAYVLDGAQDQSLDSSSFAPLFSWAKGGLAEAWTGGCYPFNEAELAPFPFRWSDIEPDYVSVARDIGVTGVEDDLSRFMPSIAGQEQPLQMDTHSRLLAERYASHRARLNARGFHLGRSRIAVLSGDRSDGRKGCAYLGRCLWGCPRRALYTPTVTLDALMAKRGFEYVPRRLVRRFRFDGDGWIKEVISSDLDAGIERSDPVEVLALAAGTLPSARIFLESWRHDRGEALRLHGLMDNRQVMVPFLTPSRIGSPFEPDSYQYNQLAMGIETEREEEYVHCLVTTLKTAMAHPIVQSAPLDLRTATWVFRHVRAALGLVNVNFHDSRRPSCWIELGEAGAGKRDRPLRIHYEPAPDEDDRVRSALKRLSSALRALGSLVVPGMTRWRPMGASVHYAGTFPMTRSPQRLATDSNCRSRDLRNLFLVDGSTFPFLPAKNLTLTLMANARRVARNAFGNGRVRL